MNRLSFKYVWHPVITCSNVSGPEQKEQSGVGENPHFRRFFRVGSVLLMYRMMKLNIFFGNLFCTVDHKDLKVDEYLIMFEKNEPCEILKAMSYSKRLMLQS